MYCTIHTLRTIHNKIKIFSRIITFLAVTGILNISPYEFIGENSSLRVVNNSCNYDWRYYKRAKKENKNTAVLVAGYNRPEYLSRVVKSLEENPESQLLPFYFFLDGGSQSKQKENMRIIQQSKIRHKEIVDRNSNYGCGRNLIDARRMLFDWCEYEKIIFFEDDVIVSPEYICLVLNLDEYAHKKYDNVGFVTAYNMAPLSLPEKLKCLNQVTVGVICIGYCMRKRVWDDIKSILYTYENSFLKNINYNQRNSPEIRKWLKETYDKSKSLFFKKPLKSEEDLIKHFIHERSPSSQDGITIFALLLRGYAPLVTKVNRAVNIGKHGIHFTPQLWEKLGFNKIKLDRFKNDSYLKEFSFLISKAINLRSSSEIMKEKNLKAILGTINGINLDHFSYCNS